VHVLQVGKFYPPEYHGGLESVVVALNRELVGRGVGVTAVVASVSGRAGEDWQDGVRVVRLGSLGTAFSQPLTLSLRQAVRTLPGDLVHLHHPNPFADALVPGATSRPLVITHHSDIVRQRWLAPLYGGIVRRALARARLVALGSEQLLRTSRELQGFEAKARVIPFGIDAARFASTPAVQARARALKAGWGGRPVVLAVGRLVGYKGFDVLLRAAAGLEATVVLVGTGPEEARLRALAGANTVFAGRVSEPDLVAYYHACDVFCLPSVTIAEAFGIVLLEAMACGKPLVTTTLPTGVSAVNRDGVTGLAVPPGDAGALRDSLGALLGDAGRRRAMGEAARNVQRAEYSAKLMGERYEAFYREALSR
jgi:glycosyltransferase involved in cell wall biosynthesis